MIAYRSLLTCTEVTSDDALHHHGVTYLYRIAEPVTNVDELYYVAEHNNKRPIRVDRPPDRNMPCHCKSGKKYKKCHGKRG